MATSFDDLMFRILNSGRAPNRLSEATAQPGNALATASSPQQASPEPVRAAQAGGPSPFAPASAGLPETAPDGTVMRGPDGHTYQYAETTGMPGATGSRGWIRANEAVVGPPDNKRQREGHRMAPQSRMATPSNYAAQGGQQARVAPSGAPQGGGGGIGSAIGNMLNPGASARNQTVQWLQQQGMDEGTATILANDKTALQKYILERSQGRDPKNMLEMEKLRLDVEEKRNPTTDDVREYQFAKGEGYDGSFTDFMTDMRKAGASSVTVGGGKYGTIPQGYQLVEGSEGARMEPIPGGPVAQEAEQAEQQRVGRQAEQRRAGVTVMREVGRAFEFLPQVSQGEGVVGANTRRALAQVPGTAEYQMQEQISSALANVGLDRLQQMRENSPTGGALGQVPFQQQKRLEQVLGGFDITQPPEILEENLRYLHNAYMDISYGAKEERERLVQEGQFNAEENQRINEAYYDLDWDEFGRRGMSPDEGRQQREGDGLGAPSPGTVEDGYRFKGGDPGDPQNWERAQ